MPNSIDKMHTALMYLLVEENPNSAPEERVFAAHGPTKTVKRVHITPPGQWSPVWCDVTAVDEHGAFIPAQAVRVDDSADGTAWLIHGGPWGLRLKTKDHLESWALDNTVQWGVPFLVLDGSGSSMETVP